ncbi:hypothetical protein EN829_062180, partial [Mesorhizobium sp. M00.F.Ca.ET.186.01.1.1]
MKREIAWLSDLLRTRKDRLDDELRFRKLREMSAVFGDDMLALRGEGEQFPLVLPPFSPRCFWHHAVFLASGDDVQRDVRECRVIIQLIDGLLDKMHLTELFVCRPGVEQGEQSVDCLDRAGLV